MIRPIVRPFARAASFCLKTLVIALVTAGTVLAFAGPDWARLLGAGRASAGYRLVLAQSEESAVSVQRSIAKDQVIGRLMAGELSLVEAAAWFRYLNDNPAEHPMDYRYHETGDSDEEKLCRQVIAWVRNRLQAESASDSQIEVVVGRLERELDARLARDGRVELPW